MNMPPYRSIWFCGWFLLWSLIGGVWGLLGGPGCVGVAGVGNAAARMFLTWLILLVLSGCVGVAVGCGGSCESSGYLL